MIELIANNYQLVEALLKRRPHIKISTLHKYRSVYLRYMTYIRQGNRKPDVVIWVSDDFGVTEQQVYRIINFFECE